MAMISKRSLEGLLMVDDRASGGALKENPTYTCCHCQTQVLVNPGRTRERAECPRCDKVMCDQCAVNYKLTLECRNFQRHLDAVERQAFKALSANMSVDPRLIVP